VTLKGLKQAPSAAGRLEPRFSAADAKAGAGPKKRKNRLSYQDVMSHISGTLAFRHYLSGFALRVLGSQAPSLLSRAEE
jgi:hypothetical protein